MLQRLTKIAMNKQDYKDELNTIKYIALQNGYNQDFINKHRQIQNKNNKPQNKNNTQQYKHITLT